MLKVNVVRDQFGNRVDNMGRRVIGVGGQHAATRHHIGPRPALNVDEPDSQFVFERVLPEQRWRATIPVVAQRRLFKSSIHRHNTPLVGPELTPEFCIESCFTYTIVRRRKTFREK